jgi:2,4-dienoyl-CoA reductase (NADPH2)
VVVKLKMRLTSGLVKDEKPDLLVVATGAVPSVLNIPGIEDHPNVVNAWDVLNGTVADIGRNVVIIGGGSIGCETALTVANLDIPTPDIFTFLVYHSADDFEGLRKMLYSSKRKITILEIADRFAGSTGISTRWSLLKNLRLLSVIMRPKTKTLNIQENSVIVEADNRKEQLIADTIIIAVGSKSLDALAREVKSDGIEVLIIGDAKEPRKIGDAVIEGFDAALGV